MIDLDFSGLELRLKYDGDKKLVYDPVRKRWVILTPEEHVRQYILLFIIHKLKYPIGLIAVEKKITLGNLTKRYDILVFNQEHKPWMLIECKEPEVPISQNTLFQLLNYHRSVPCKYWLLSNGHQTFCADARDFNAIKWLDQLPFYNS